MKCEWNLSEWKIPKAVVRKSYAKQLFFKYFAKSLGKHLPLSLFLLELQISGTFMRILRNS